MKNLIILLIAFLSITTVISCKKESSNELTAAKVKSDAEQGTWKITFLYRDSVNITSDFNGYNFTFNPSGIVNAVNPILNNPGNWSVSESNGSVKFLISYTSPASFVRLNNSWSVVSSSGAAIRLIGTATNGSLTDQLLFEKN